MTRETFPSSRLSLILSRGCKADDRKRHFNGNHSRDHCPFYWWRRIVYEREERPLDMTVQPPNMFPLPAEHGVAHHVLQGLWQLVTALRPHRWQQGQICNVRLSLLLTTAATGVVIIGGGWKRPEEGPARIVSPCHHTSTHVCWDRGEGGNPRQEWCRQGD